MNNSADTVKLIDAVERSVKFVRELLLLVGLVFLVVYFLPVLGGLRKRLTPASIQSLSIGPISVKLKAEITTFVPSTSATAITIDAIQGIDPFILEKGSAEVLQEVQARLRSSKGERIDVIEIVPGKSYNGKLLQQYISLLGARFIIFQGSKLDGWMDASSFAAQLLPFRNYDYQQLLENTVGVSDDFARKNSTAMVVLNMMQKVHLDNLAVVDDKRRFMFMVSRQDILSKVVTSLVLEQQIGNHVNH